MDSPDKKTVEQYLRGTLSAKEHATVELWLDEQPEDVITTIFEEASLQIEKTPSRIQPGTLHTRDQFYFTPDFRLDRYHYRKELGSGGMGVVELADDQSLVRKVAVKRCRPRGYNETVKSYKQRQRLFQREAEIIGSLEHPGIIPIHEIGIDAFGNPAMIMKALSGHDFEQWRNDQITKNGLVDLAEGLRIIMKISDALAYAHENGVVHRDVKVDNVLIGNYGEVTVIDWGLAVKIKELPDLNADTFTAHMTGAYGTPSWMAPEQALAVTADPRMDVWAVGGLLLFLFTGSDPRPDIERDSNVTTEQISKPILLNPENLKSIPAGIQAVIQRCLSHAPQDRYADCSEIVDELKQWITKGVTKAQDPGFILRLMASMRGHPIVAGVIITLLLSFSAAIITEWIRYQNKKDLIENIAKDLIDQTDMGNMNEVESAQKQLNSLQLRYGSEHAAFLSAEQYINSTLGVLGKHKKQNELKIELDNLEHRFRITGPWNREIEDRRRVHDLSGLNWRNNNSATINQQKNHPLSGQLLKNLAHLQVAMLIHDKNHEKHNHDEHEPLNNYMYAVDLGESWSALSKLLEQATVSAHEIVLVNAEGKGIDPSLLSACLSDHEVGDLLLALCLPNEQLLAYANDRWKEAPDSFWPCIVIARNALVKEDFTKARVHALIALGQEGKSIWPQLFLGYVEMMSNNLAQAQVWVDSILRNHPDHLETRILNAVIMAKMGDKRSAQREVNAVSAWDHFHVHEESGGGHPMDISIEILKEEGISLHDSH